MPETPTPTLAERKTRMEGFLHAALTESTFVVDLAPNENIRATLLEAQETLHDVVRLVRSV